MPSAKPKHFSFPIPHIRLGEFDLGRVLYHANYFHLYESAREEFLKQGGTPYPLIVADFSHLAIVESHQSFSSPIFYGQELELQLSITDVKGTSVKIGYEIFATGESKPLHVAWTKLVYVKNTGNGYKAERIPDNLRKLFLEFENSEPTQ